MVSTTTLLLRLLRLLRRHFFLFLLLSSYDYDYDYYASDYYAYYDCYSIVPDEHASRGIQRIRTNLLSNSLNVSARVLISDDLLSMRL